MLEYLVRRLLIACVTLVMITFVAYGLIRAMPGSPLTVEMAETDPGKRGMSEQDQEQLKKLYRLDLPFYQAYGLWVRDVFIKRDFGLSISRKQPVGRMIREKMGPTLLLSSSSLLLTYLLSIPLGLFATARTGKPDERTMSTILYMLYSVPVYVGGLALQIILNQKYGWFPLAGMKSDEYETFVRLGKIKDVLWHATLPIVCLTYTSLAYYTRFIRSNMQEVIRQDYIRTARAKGVSWATAICKHAFRNSLIPLVTSIGLSLPSLLGGSVIVERIFNWPGMGNLFFESIGERDYPTTMALMLIFSVLTLAGQMLSDVLYSIVDPRVRLSSR